MERLWLICDLESPRTTIDESAQPIAAWAYKELAAQGRISIGSSGELELDLRDRAIQAAAMLRSGEIRIEPKGHAERIARMLCEERIWEIGRAFDWGFRPADHGLSPHWPGALDTWFTSALWPWIDQGFEAEPYGALCIGYDIGFFWAARMIMMALALGLPIPFRTIKLHGLIRDSQGRKFSKSLGNGIDPELIIAKEGADALRMWAASNAAWGSDFRFDPRGIEKHSRWLTKIANACRLLEMRAPTDPGDPAEEIPDPEFAAQAETIGASIGNALENWRLPEALGLLQSWSREWLCESFLSRRSKTWSSEPKSWRQDLAAIKETLAIAHPFAPQTSIWLRDRLDKLPTSKAG